MRTLLVCALPLPLALVLAGCGEPDREADPEPVATPTPAEPRTLIPADLDISTLGAKIEGPQGPEPEAPLMLGGAEVGRIVSYVACPRGAEACVPDEMPEGTVYTFVHQITLDGVSSAADDTGPEVVEAPPTLFRTTERAHGFNGSIGYARSQAMAAFGSEDAVSVTFDDGRLIWRVTGAPDWRQNATVTFWWQSTLPPAGPADAFLLEVMGNQIAAKGPFPAAEKPAGEPAAN